MDGGMIIKQIWQNGEDAKLPSIRALLIAIDAGFSSVECINNDLMTGVVSYRAIQSKVAKKLA